MTVIIANDTPAAIRGILKRWFLEPKPNVFVGTLNRRTRDNVTEFVVRNAVGISFLVIHSDPNCQGFKIVRYGNPDRRDIELSGLSLIAEQWVEEESRPF